MSERWNAQAQLEHLQQKYVGAGNPDTTKWEWGCTIRRDSLSSHIGHHSRMLYMAMAENESIARSKHNMLWKMVQPCGPPPKKSGTTNSKERTTSGKSKNIGNYLLGRAIGEGTFGKVKLGTHNLTGEKVAIKILEKDRICDVADVERVSREIHILKLIRHANIIQLYEIIETPTKLFLIMEYANGGELFDYIVASTRIKEKEACRFFQQIIAGVEYIHKLNVVHRDLKPENLLLDHNKNIKIVDFGLSNTYKPGELLKTACGSPCYAAPEMIAGKKYMGSRVDIWSSGVILFAMICGYLPFEDPNTGQLYKKILAGDYHCPKFITPEAKDLLKCVLNTDPDQRYTIDQIRAHPWYNQIKHEVSPGILVGYDYITVDQSILKKLEDYSLDTQHAQKCIEANKHNHITTAYYLLLKKHLQNGGTSIADYSHMSEGDLSQIIPSSKLNQSFNQTITNVPHPPLFKLKNEQLITPINPRHRRIVNNMTSYRAGSTGGSGSKEVEKLESSINMTQNYHIRGISHQLNSFKFGGSPKSRGPQSVSPHSKNGNPRQKHLKYRLTGKETIVIAPTPRPPSRITPNGQRPPGSRGRVKTPGLNESTDMDANRSLNNTFRFSPRAAITADTNHGHRGRTTREKLL